MNGIDPHAVGPTNTTNQLADEPLMLRCRIPAECAGQRLDVALSRLFPDYSRSRLQTWIRDGQVRVDGGHRQPRQKVFGGERVEIDAVVDRDPALRAQDLPLDIVYSDSDLLVVDKPAGLVVHPAAGNPDGTLVNALLHYDGDLARLPRAGLVHRLDKDTTGLLVVARSLRAHSALVAQLQARQMKRQYCALVWGDPGIKGQVDAPIGRHPVDRKRMAVVASGKPARTFFERQAVLGACTVVTVRLDTGRTHQIRVHMTHIGHPLVGDPVYGRRQRPWRGLSDQVATLLAQFGRQALHARSLGLIHPVSGQPMEWQAPVPADMSHLIDTLRAQFGSHDR